METAMNRRTKRTDFRDKLTAEEVDQLLKALCEARRSLCDLQMVLYPLSEDHNAIEAIKQAIDTRQAHWTGNPTHFYAGHAAPPLSLMAENDA